MRGSRLECAALLLVSTKHGDESGLEVEAERPVRRWPSLVEGDPSWTTEAAVKMLTLVRSLTQLESQAEVTFGWTKEMGRGGDKKRSLTIDMGKQL